MASKKISSCRTYGNGEIENSKNASAHVSRKKVSDKSGRDGDKSCFADSDQGVANEQFRVGVGERR